MQPHHSATEPALIRAATGKQGDGPIPVWFMRQAGRSLPEYRKVREGTTMLQSCRDPELVTEITLQPVRRHGVDAAIFFSDIMVPLAAAGIDLDIVPGTGPVIAEPVRDAAAIRALPELEPDSLGFITDSVSMLVEQLGPVPLIGFAGAPFTLASYLVEGRPSRDYAHTKALMVSEPELWDELCAKLARISTTFLSAQAAAGARAVQLFDSWVGSLSAADYEEFVAAHSSTVLHRLAERFPTVPRIHFGVGTGELLAPMAAAGADVIGVDWRVPLAEAVRRTGGGHAVQGNLDPALLGAPWPVIADRVREVIRSGAVAPGHIFNLGHGVPPQTDPTVLTRIVELVHAEGAELRAEARAAAQKESVR
ncbi:uroporphyrinogen decarboxylase [Naumannella halotolerans]|uniref:Uroporphyrinogen decarboxylase n=1 Tax=Naumannella halotolerans TaxID=993414 RepID=A0A4R7J7P3_9ACTN|nr:uroporphyrinogen decarboxylase [Naumannella halotolerans]TDT33265.1 uroporphyrinogen decarboxylase [Naumannella halotolerans]